MYCAWISELEDLHQPRLGGGGVVAGPDDLDDLVDVEQRDEETVDEVQPVLALGAAEHAAATHDLDAVVDVDLEQLAQAQRARLAVDQRDVVDPERLLHRREAVELLQHRLGVEAVLDLDDEAQALLPVGEVLQVRDARELLRVDQVLDLRDDALGADARTAAR